MPSTWPVQRHDDPEMHAAIVREIAQYILRGRAHQTRPPHTDAQIAARTRQVLSEAAGSGYMFTQPETDWVIEAGVLADGVQDRSPDWADWAFGH